MSTADQTGEPAASEALQADTVHIDRDSLITALPDSTAIDRTLDADSTRIAAITDNRTVCNILALSFGVHPLLVPLAALTDSELALLLKGVALIHSGQRIVITAGTTFGVTGTTNSLRILDIG